MDEKTTQKASAVEPMTDAFACSMGAAVIDYLLTQRPDLGEVFFTELDTTQEEAREAMNRLDALARHAPGERNKA
jgi:hypothetical protein